MSSQSQQPHNKNLLPVPIRPRFRLQIPHNLPSTHRYHTNDYSMPIFGTDQDIGFLFQSYYNPFGLHHHGDPLLWFSSQEPVAFGTFIFTPRNNDISYSFSNDELQQMCTIPNDDDQSHSFHIPGQDIVGMIYRPDYNDQITLYERTKVSLNSPYNRKEGNSIINDHYNITTTTQWDPIEVVLPRPRPFQFIQKQIHPLEFDFDTILVQKNQNIIDSHDEFLIIKENDSNGRTDGIKNEQNNDDDQKLIDTISDHMMISLPLQFPYHQNAMKLTKQNVLDQGQLISNSSSLLQLPNVTTTKSLEHTLSRTYFGHEGGITYTFPGPQTLINVPEYQHFYQLLLPLNIQRTNHQQLINITPMKCFNLSHLKFSSATTLSFPLWCLTLIIDLDNTTSIKHFQHFYQMIQGMYLQGTLFPFYKLPIFIFIFNSHQIDRFNEYNTPLSNHHQSSITPPPAYDNIYPAPILPYTNPSVVPNDYFQDNLSLSTIRHLLSLLPFDETQIFIYELERENEQHYKERCKKLREEWELKNIQNKHKSTNNNDTDDDNNTTTKPTITLPAQIPYLHQTTIIQLLSSHYINIALTKLQPIDENAFIRQKYLWGWRSKLYLHSLQSQNNEKRFIEPYLSHYTVDKNKYLPIWYKSTPTTSLLYYKPHLPFQRYYIEKNKKNDNNSILHPKFEMLSYDQSPTNNNNHNDDQQLQQQDQQEEVEKEQEQEQDEEYIQVQLQLPSSMEFHAFINTASTALIPSTSALPSQLETKIKLPFTPLPIVQGLHPDGYTSEITVTSPENKLVDIQCTINYEYNIITPLCYFLPQYYTFGIHLIPMYYSDYPCQFIMDNLPGAILQILLQPITTYTTTKCQNNNNKVNNDPINNIISYTAGDIRYYHTYMQCKQYFIFYFINKIDIGEQLPSNPNELQLLITKYENILRHTFHNYPWTNTSLTNVDEIVQNVHIKVCLQDDVVNELKLIQLQEVERKLSAIHYDLCDVACQNE